MSTRPAMISSKGKFDAAATPLSSASADGHCLFVDGPMLANLAAEGIVSKKVERLPVRSVPRLDQGP
jgi:hypothetical protein